MSAATTPGDGREALRAELERVTEAASPIVRGVRLASVNTVMEFYEQRGFQPAWSDKQRVQALLEALRGSMAHGLDPDDYLAGDLESLVARLNDVTVMSAVQRASTDILLTEAFLRYGLHLRFGRVKRATMSGNWRLDDTATRRRFLAGLQQAFGPAPLDDFLATYAGRGMMYEALKKALAGHRRLATIGPWPTVPAGATLRPGMHDDRVADIAERLALTGDLARGAGAGRPESYDVEIEAGVRRFQRRHGLVVDGLVGPETRAAMNVPVEVRIDQLKLALERVRWLPDINRNDAIVINVAAYRAYLYRDGEPVWEAKVQVGEAETKTPLFTDEVSYLVLNPTWTVPYSIASEELLPDIQSDPSFLERGGYEVRNSAGENIDPANVDGHALGENNFPYTLVQMPGPMNALGNIKFMFPNEYDVCMHDTPSRSLFRRSNRATSHGCIRLQNPLGLAAELLAEDGWGVDEFDSAIVAGETLTLPLAEPVPIVLLYATAWIDADGTPLFFNDVYERDELLLDALQRRYSPGDEAVGRLSD